MGPLQETKPLEETDPIAKRHIAKVQAEHDEQYLALRRRAQGLFEVLKGRTGVHTPEQWRKIFEEAHARLDDGSFLLERLGTSRFTDPDLMAVLLRLRQELLAQCGNPTAAEKMQVDMAVLAYRNALRVQSLVNSALIETERQLFGQRSLDEVLGQAEASEVARILADVEQKLLPLLERCQRMLNRALDRLQGPGRAKSGASVSIGVAGQVNVG